MSPPAIPVSDAGRGRRRGERGGIQRRRQKRRRAVDDDDKREIAGGISDRLWAEPGQNPEFGMDFEQLYFRPRWLMNQQRRNQNIAKLGTFYRP